MKKSAILDRIKDVRVAWTVIGGREAYRDFPQESK